jgi:hypothetical protein
MSKFEDLSALAVRWQSAGHENWIRLWRATFQLTRGFAKYIDAMGVYADPKTGQGVRYVETMRHGYREDGTSVPLPVDSYMDALDMESDGYVRFSIATAFEQGPKTYPKIRVGVFLRMKIVGNTIHVQLLNKTYVLFELDQEDPTTHVKLFEAIVDLLETSFEMRPGDEPRLSSIGFALAKPAVTEEMEPTQTQQSRATCSMQKGAPSWSALLV